MVATTREEWLQGRSDSIGASEVAAVLGLSTWDSPYSLWSKKCGLAPVDTEETEWQRWGNILEPAICEEYAVQTGRKVIDHGRYATRRSQTCPVLSATLDREVEAFDERGPGCMDAKNVAVFKAQDWSDTPPLLYQVQLQAQMEVTGYRWGSLAALIGGNTFRWCDVERNESFIELMRKKCMEFWNLIETQTPPPIDGSASTAAALARMFPQETGEAVALPGEALDWDETIKSCNAAINQAEETKTEAQNKLRAAIGSASFGVLPAGGRYSLKSTTRKAHTVGETTFRTLRRLAK